jgi:predicted membrane protein
MLLIFFLSILLFFFCKLKVKKIFDKEPKKIVFIAIVLFVLFRFPNLLPAALLLILITLMLIKIKKPDFKIERDDFTSFKSRNPAFSPMSKEEAREILGVETGASKAEIKKAYHRLMLKNHPDHGGSKYIATKLNAARNILLDQ